jgi:peptidase E
MKLFLASEGSDPVTIQKLEIYTGGLKGKKVVYIPTARNGENPFNTWQDSGTWKFLNSSGMIVSYVQLEDHMNYLNPDLFKDADILWMSGGACGYLMYWIYRTGFDKMLPKILEKTLYVGSSAGSMITAPTLEIADWYIGESEPGASFIPGLGLVDFDFYPHYEDELKTQIEKLYNGKKMYLVKNGEVVIVEDKKISVLGDERIIKNE